MSCNGCRVLRKGCGENCMLRQSLLSIRSPQAQGHATLFAAKFFGRSALLSFIAAVPQDQRPALFQSLLFEAVGRTINPVGGAVGLVSTGNWHLCQAGLNTVLRGGMLRVLPELITARSTTVTDIDDFSSESAAQRQYMASHREEVKITPAGTKRGRGSNCGDEDFGNNNEESETMTLGSWSWSDDGIHNMETKEGKLLRLFV